MDDLLQRMLVVEKEADELVRQAEAKAVTVGQEARRDLAESARDFRAETARLAEQLLATEIAKADEHKQQALAEADKELSADLVAFRTAVGDRVAALTHALAFPGS